MSATQPGPIKTFPQRRIKDSPPYLYHGRLLTLEDMVEFFKLVQELKLNQQEKADLVAVARSDRPLRNEHEVTDAGRQGQFILG